MKKFLSALSLLALWAVPSNAQNEIVLMGDVTCDMTVQDAVHFKKEDSNGMVCALLIIHPTEKLDETLYLEAVNSQLSVWKYTTRPNGDVLFHLQPGIQRLKLSMMGCKALLFDIPLPQDYQGSKRGAFEAKTYEMTISVDRGNVLMTNNFFKISITPSDPSAVIEYANTKKGISGLFVCTDPMEGAYETERIPLGKYHYRLKSDFYEEMEGDYELTDSSDPLTLSLIPKFSYLAFDGAPEKATILVDGKPFSSKRRYFRGTHSVRVSASGFIDKSFNIEIKGNGTTETFPVEMSSNQAYVTFTCSDPQANIYVDDEFVGKTGTRYTLKGGLRYQATARREGFSDSSVSFNIGIGESKTVSVGAPVELFGVLNVSSTPGNADVRIGDAPSGRTSLSKKIRIGTYEVSCSKEGYLTQKRSVTVDEGRQTDVVFKLEKSVRSEEVSITTDADARIIIDGVDTGKSGFFSDKLKEGTHYVTATKPDCFDESMTIDVKAGGSNYFKIPSPKHKQGTISFTSSPSGASVQIQGKDKSKTTGTTPFTKTLPVGDYSFWATKSGYYGQGNNFHVYEGNNLTQNIRMKKYRWLWDGQDSHNLFTEASVTFDNTTYKHDNGVLWGVNFGWVPAHIGVFANASVGTNGATSLSVAPVIRLTNDYNAVDFQVYAGIGKQFDSISEETYDYRDASYPYSWHQGTSYSHKDETFFEFGLRMAFDNSLADKFQWLSFSAGLRVYDGRVAPTLGMSLIPLRMFDGVGGPDNWFSDTQDFPAHSIYFKYLMFSGETYYDDWHYTTYYDQAFSFGYQYLKSRVGFYGDFLFDGDSTVGLGAGVALRLIDDSHIADLQLYTGGGYFDARKYFSDNGTGWYGETGIRIGWDTSTAISLTDVSFGVTYGSGFFGLSVGVSIILPMCIYLWPLFL